MALINKLNAIGEAIRAKTGKSGKLTLDEMVTEIGNITTGENLDDVLTVQETLIDELKEVLQGKAAGSASIIIEAPNELTENRTYTASEFGADGINKFTVNVPVPEGDTLTEFLSWRGGIYLFYNLTSITTIPSFDTSVVTNMYGMFEGCTKLTSVSLFDTSKVTNMNNMFKGCTKLTSVPLFDTRKAMAIGSMFYNCSSLTTIPALDLRMCSTYLSAFNGCKALTDIRIRNIFSNLQVSNGTSYGHLLTVDSLVHLIYELRKRSDTETLTVGTANLEKLADVYVKAIDITDEMRAEDDLIDEKYPFVRCESTDEGAMLITTYASTIKNWTIK